MDKLRIAVTGLSGSGKTVFLTSLINHLLEGNEESLTVFKDEGAGFSAKKARPKSGTSRFPYSTYLEAYRGKDPRWPKHTSDISEFHIHLRLRRGKKRRKLRLELVDYPGERLLDLPLLDKSYEDWSDETIVFARTGMRKQLSKPWLKACAKPIRLAIPLEKVPTGRFAIPVSPTISSSASIRAFRTPLGRANILP